MDDLDRWQNSIAPILLRKSPITPPPFEGEPENFEDLFDKQVLVVGSGGLGCEILKNLAMSGVKNIHIIDLDTIELSNLNRQFLFRHKDIGRYKSEVAAEFVMNRCEGVDIKHYTKPLETFDKDFYSDFDIVIAGLDSVKARRWLNSMLVSLVEVDEEGNIDFDTVIPFIDGGTEGWKGQARLFMPRLSSCYECSLASLPPQQGFAGCTIANVPRLPEHCITYAFKVLWKRLRRFDAWDDYEMVDEKEDFETDIKLDTDSVDHMNWVYHRSLERAEEFDIDGVTFNLTMQVVKNIIPAIAATNALISASCVNEAFKALTWSSYNLQNFFMYMGQTGVYARTFPYERDPNCVVCGSVPMKFKIDPSATFEDLMLMVRNHPRLDVVNFSVTNSNDQFLYLVKGALAKQYSKNLDKPVNEVVNDGETIFVMDKAVLGFKPVLCEVSFEEGKFFLRTEDSEMLR